MTNQDAFKVYYPDDARAVFVLESKSIVPTGTDDNAVSGAWGMIEATKTADYSQGRTSETLSAGARRQLLNDAKQILRDNGFYYNDGTTPTVGSVIW